MATASATEIASQDRADEPERSFLKTAKRAFGTFRAHEMTDHAATLTYFVMMSLFPGVVVAISLLGIFGQASLAGDAGRYIAENGGDKETADFIRATLDKLLSSSGGGIGVALAISILIGLNGASGAFAAAGRALNTVHAVDEDRGFVRRKVTDIGFTLVVILLLAIVLVSLFLGGGIADDLFGTIGLGSTGALIWSIARWPVALVLAMVAFGIVYAFAPDVEPRRMRWLTPGAVVAVVIWIVASILFGFYIKNFGSYGAAYGAAGAAIVLLLWLYLTGNAFLFGAELNMALEREQTAGRGGPPMVTPPPTAEHPVPTATAPRSAQDPDGNQSSGGPGEQSSG